METKQIIASALQDVSRFYVRLDLDAVCKKEDISLYQVEFADDTVSGMLLKHDNKWDIYVNKKNSIYRQRFTIAHELGHYYAQKYGSPSTQEYLKNNDDMIQDFSFLRKEKHGKKDDIAIEREANQIAAEILMPKNSVKDLINDKKDVSEMATVFGVSEVAMSYRLKNLGFAVLESLW